MNQQPGAQVWAVFSENAMIAGTNNGRELDPYHTGYLSETWNTDRIRNEAEAGRVHKADSLVELAQNIDVDPLSLRVTVERYNADVKEGLDREWSKKLDPQFSIDEPPFYALQLRACVIGQTSAGLSIDANGRVQDVHGRIIDGYTSSPAAIR